MQGFYCLSKNTSIYQRIISRFFTSKGKKKKHDFIFGICFKSEASYKPQ